MRLDSLSTSSFPVFVSSYLSLNCVPVNLDVASILLELVDILLLVVLLKESGTVSNDCVNVRLVVDCDIECSLPSV